MRIKTVPMVEVLKRLKRFETLNFLPIGPGLIGVVELVHERLKWFSSNSVRRNMRWKDQLLHAWLLGISILLLLKEVEVGLLDVYPRSIAYVHSGTRTAMSCRPLHVHLGTRTAMFPSAAQLRSLHSDWPVSRRLIQRAQS